MKKTTVIAIAAVAALAVAAFVIPALAGDRSGTAAGFNSSGFTGCTCSGPISPSFIGPLTSTQWWSSSGDTSGDGIMSMSEYNAYMNSRTEYRWSASKDPKRATNQSRHELNMNNSKRNRSRRNR